MKSLYILAEVYPATAPMTVQRISMVWGTSRSRSFLKWKKNSKRQQVAGRVAIKSAVREPEEASHCSRPAFEVYVHLRTWSKLPRNAGEKTPKPAKMTVTKAIPTSCRENNLQKSVFRGRKLSFCAGFRGNSSLAGARAAARDLQQQRNHLHSGPRERRKNS